MSAYPYTDAGILRLLELRQTGLSSAELTHHIGRLLNHEGLSHRECSVRCTRSLAWLKKQTKVRFDKADRLWKPCRTPYVTMDFTLAELEAMQSRINMCSNKDGSGDLLRATIKIENALAAVARTQKARPSS